MIDLEPRSGRLGPLATTQVAYNLSATGLFFLLPALAISESDGFGPLLAQGLAQAAPALAFYLLVRVISIRLNYRVLAVVCLALEAAVCALVGWWVLVEGYELSAMVIVAAVLGFTNLAQASGRQSALTDAIPEESRRRVLSSVATANNVARLVAPIIAGATLFAGSWASWLLVQSTVCSWSLIVLVRNADIRRAVPTQSADTLSLTEGKQRVWPLLVAFGAFAVFGLNIQVLAPVIADTRLGDLATFAGWVVATHTLGAIVGVYVVGKMKSELPHVFVVGSFVLGVSVAALAVSMPAWLVFSVVAIAGVGRGAALNAAGLMATLYFHERQERERLIALNTIVFSAANLISVPAIALSLTIGGLGAAAVLCGFGCVMASLFWLRTGMTWWLQRQKGDA